MLANNSTKSGVSAIVGEMKTPPKQGVCERG